MARKVFPAVFIIACVVAAQSAAGDAATFTNLGFSDNGGTFMFGQYGVERSTSQAYAQIFTVDVPANEFVPNGVFRRTFDNRISAGQDGNAALLTLLRDAEPIRAEHNINHLRQGRLVYLLLSNEEAPGEISFRDFSAGSSYFVRLEQDYREQEDSVEARFHLEVERETADGTTRSYTIGRPDFYRSGVRRYRVRQILLSPDERSIVFVMEMDRPTASGTSIRHMVETARF